MARLFLAAINRRFGNRIPDHAKLLANIDGHQPHPADTAFYPLDNLNRIANFGFR